MLELGVANFDGLEEFGSRHCESDSSFKSVLSVGLQVFVDYGDVYDNRTYIYHYE